jgi:hypothetical protein
MAKAPGGGAGNGTFGPANEETVNNPTLWMPTIIVSLSDSIDIRKPRIVVPFANAVVDTGSAFCSIDDQIISDHPTFTKAGTSTIITATGIANVDTYWVQIIFGENLLQMLCNVAPLRREGGLFDLLFGMDAIRFFDLQLVRSRRSVTLSWTGP